MRGGKKEERGRNKALRLTLIVVVVDSSVSHSFLHSSQDEKILNLYQLRAYCDYFVLLFTSHLKSNQVLVTKV